MGTALVFRPIRPARTLNHVAAEPEWSCICGPGEERGGHVVHNASCVIRRRDGSRPQWARPYGILPEPGEPDPELAAVPRRAVHKRTRAQLAQAQQDARRLRQAGQSMPAIAASMGVSVNCVWKWLHSRPRDSGPA